MIQITLLTLCIAVITLLFYAIYQVKLRFTNLKNQLSLSKTQLSKEIEQQVVLKQNLIELESNIVSHRIDDPLTGLPSQQTFQDRLTQTLSQSQRYNFTFAVMILDLDSFRTFKNVLGLESCNQLLREVAGRLRTCIRPMDTVGRGDSSEFLFIIPQLAKPETAAYVCKRILEVIAQPFSIQQQEIFLTASIGIAVYPNDGDSPALLIQNADQALLQAKSNGNNSYQFYQKEMHAFSQRELALSSCLHNTETFQQFVIHYQPWVNTTTKKIVSMEAFLHWNHPQYGMIPQKDFIRLTEKSGNMLAIGEWLLRNACKQLQQWQSLGFHPQALAVNISLRQLENPHFTYQVSKILQEMKLAPQNLILQLSEILLVNKISMVEKSLHMLNHLGIQICIDHFGTGNIALQHLKGLPISLLKMDKIIIKDLAVNEEAEAIVKMILALAQTLKWQVVADGVDTLQQKQRLKELQCEVIQGEMICAPMAVAQFTVNVEQQIVAQA